MFFYITFFNKRHNTVCPRNLDAFNIVTYYIKWVFLERLFGQTVQYSIFVYIV